MAHAMHMATGAGGGDSADGDAHTWGANHRGALGHGGTEDRRAPEPVAALRGRFWDAAGCD